MTQLARLRETLLALAGVTLLAAITAWIVDVPGRLGIALYEEQFLALVLGCSAGSARQLSTACCQSTRPELDLSV